MTISVRYERYVRGLRAAGHEPVTVCIADAAAGYKEPVTVAPQLSAFQDALFYKSLGAKTAILINWLGLPDIVAAAKAGCGKVVALADSDGLVGVRVHPRATLARMVHQHQDLLTKLRAAFFWLRLYAFGPQLLDDPVLLSSTEADRIVVCDMVAAANLQSFFKHYGRPDLSAKVAAVPYPVDECFLNEQVAAHRSRTVLAVGRWDDPQKDALLLTKGVQQYLDNGGQAAFAFVGAGGDKVFGGLCNRYKAVRYHGVLPPAQVVDLMGEARLLLLTSRWESGPIVLFEALARGCTVVGPESIPGVESVCAAGPYGTMFKKRSAQAVAHALERELATWDAGERDPQVGAAFWQPQFDPRNVCLRLLGTADA